MFFFEGFFLNKRLLYFSFVYQTEKKVYGKIEVFIVDKKAFIESRAPHFSVG